MRKRALIIILSVIFGCRNTDNDGFIKREYYSNGALASEIPYNRDTIMQGTAKFFYKNGQLAEEGNFTKGKKNGPYTAYYLDGTIKEQGNFLLDEPLGSFYYYYPNGKLELYNAQDYRKEVFYVLKLDSTGKKLREEGMVISPTASSPTYKKNYTLGDSLVLEFCIAQPPGYKVRVTASYYLTGRTGLRTMPSAFTEIPIFRSLASYRLKFLELGSYDIICAGELCDMRTGLKKYDTTHTYFTIR